MAVVRALTDSETREPFLKNLERFGLLPGEKSAERNRDGFPVGIVTNSIPMGDLHVTMFGFTCAACHTSDLRYNGKTFRVEGGSGLFYVDALGDAIGNSLNKTLANEQELLAFLRRLFEHAGDDSSSLLGRLVAVTHLEQGGEFEKELIDHLRSRLAALHSQLKPAEIHSFDDLQAGGEALRPLSKEEILAVAKKLLTKAHAAGSPLERIAAAHRLPQLIGALTALEGNLENLKYRLRFLKMRAWLQAPGHRLTAGYGRADDFGTARVELFGDLESKTKPDKERNLEPVNAPVSVPPLWNIDQFAWLHWNSNTNSVIQRSIGESIGVGATFSKAHTTSVDIVNQMAIEEQIKHIAAPVWPTEFLPAIDPAKAAQGKELYAKHCAKCHDPTDRDNGLLVFKLSTVEEAGTDPADAVNFDRPVFQADGTTASFAGSIATLLQQLQDKAKEGMSASEKAQMEALEAPRRPVRWRDTKTATGGPVYPARPLDGVWSTAPYLHNGSVPTLYHLLLPPDQRPKTFVVGVQDFDPVHVGFEWDPAKYPDRKDPHVPHKRLFDFDTTQPGNLNTGHDYGNKDLTDDQRLALIEYLKIHKTPSLDAPAAVAAEPAATNDWASERAVAQSDLEAYLTQHADEATWFAGAADGSGGVPFLLMRLLPEIAPEIWGVPQENFSRFGLFPPAEDPKRPLPLGLAWDTMTGQPAGPLQVVSFSCGACHIGRVRTGENVYRQLIGAPNVQFDVRKWRHALEQTVAARLNTPEQIAEVAVKVRELIAAKPANYFYGRDPSQPDEVEAKERALLSTIDAAANQDVARDVLTSFASGVKLSLLAIKKQKETSYSKANAPPLDGGSPGQSDGSGDLIPRLLMYRMVSERGPAATAHDFPGTNFPELPNQLATVTDILSTFQQGRKDLAQIDGSVKSPFFRNIAASLAVAGDPRKVNVQNADLTARFLRDLPPPPYPFEIDMASARRGEALFSEHCAVCHRDFNDTLYAAQRAGGGAQIGTDSNRSQVLNESALALFIKYFVESVPPDYETTNLAGEKYRPSELPADQIVIDRTVPERQGYVTDALYGAWSRAPYLHNGSVPTLRHLLVPAERPEKFVRGSVSYDPQFVGYAWDSSQHDSLKVIDPTVILFDTGWDGASKGGHDTNLTVDDAGAIVRIGWEGAVAPNEHRVRLDWSGPEHAKDLSDLLEYLKTR